MERAMEYILTVYKEQSFTKAASRLYITQPALSAIVKKEEDSLGVKLFNRNVKPFVLTSAGTKYIQAALKIKRIESAMINELKALSNIKVDSLTIGSSSYFCANVLPTFTERFRELYPEAHIINLMEGNTYDLVEQLQDGTVDFVLSVDTHYGENCNSLVLKKETLILAVPASYLINRALVKQILPVEDIKSGTYLRPDYPAISLKPLGKEPFIVLKKGNDMYQRAQKMFKNAGISPKIVMSMDQLQSAYFVARDGKGCTFIRADMVNYVETSGKLVYYKLQDELSQRDINLFYKKKKEYPPVAEDFLSYCKNYAKELK